MSISKVLDLDLDFFVWPVVRGHVKTRPAYDDHPCASVEQVRAYLEQQCGLSRTDKLPGRFCKKHDGAFYAWKKWLAKDSLTNQFEVAHLDGHSDLSFGDASLRYIFLTTLSLPPNLRSKPPRGINRMNEGSYLTFAIANRWLQHLTYVYPINWWSDYGSLCTEASTGFQLDLSDNLFKDRDRRSGEIQLRHLCTRDFDLLVGGGSVTPIAIEPKVPIDLIPANRFSQTGFTHMILAHSEKYCPPEADSLISVIQEYFYDAY